MKILYAADNDLASYFQMRRIVSSLRDKKIDVKIAAYKNSSGYFDVDFTLDSLLNFTKPNRGLSFNGNYDYYANEIKRFNPDLIISDMEVYTSLIAYDLNIKVWQVSSKLLFTALPVGVKTNLKIKQFHSLDDESRFIVMRGLLKYAQKKFVYSHFCDVEASPELSHGYQWVRPDFILVNTKDADNAALYFNAENSAGNFIFTDATHSMNVYSMYDDVTYLQALSKCNTVVCDPIPIIVADAVYNQRKCIFSKSRSITSTITSVVGEHFVYDNIKICDDVKNLVDHIGDL